jgi:spore coat polysaccharide biosynthesis predicted glycosyltransferase SpsG
MRIRTYTGYPQGVGHVVRCVVLGVAMGLALAWYVIALYQLVHDVLSSIIS